MVGGSSVVTTKPAWTALQIIIPELATRALHFSNSRESVKRRQAVYKQASDGDFKKQLKDGNICATRVDKGSSLAGVQRWQ
jgi:hypothetical protein